MALDVKPGTLAHRKQIQLCDVMQTAQPIHQEDCHLACSAMRHPKHTTHVCCSTEDRVVETSRNLQRPICTGKHSKTTTENQATKPENFRTSFVSYYKNEKVDFRRNPFGFSPTIANAMIEVMYEQFCMRPDPDVRIGT